MNRPRVLLAGETWITVASHHKGWDSFTTTTYHDGAVRFTESLDKSHIAVEHLSSHLVPAGFPCKMEELRVYDAIILSDIGANSLLLHPDTWLEGKTTVNRLQLIHDYVLGGGGLVMVGGYLSFQGIHGSAAYGGTPIEAVLPVSMLPRDDRQELPDGAVVHAGSRFSELPDAPASLPAVLGYNKVHLRDGSALIYTCDDAPLLAIREVGEGRSVAWTSDMGPHWCPEQFLSAAEYGRLWRSIVLWVTKRA